MPFHRVIFGFKGYTNKGPSKIGLNPFIVIKPFTKLAQQRHCNSSRPTGDATK
jgi:hypothetical protein